MDPQVCFDEMVRHLAAKEWIEAGVCARDLREWILKGGVAPKVNSKLEWDVLLRFVIKGCGVVR